MELIYYLQGETAFLLKNKIEEIKLEAVVDEFNIIKYDALEDDLKDIVKELNTVSFFDDKKITIVNNVNHLKRFSKEELELFEKYLKNPNSDNIVILISNVNIDDKYIKGLFDKYCYIENISNIKLEDLPKYILKIFTKDNFTIDKEAIQLLIQRTMENQDLLEVEITKLMTYKLEEKHISYEDVLSLVPRTLEDNIFEFTQNYLNKQTKTYMRIYYDLISARITPLTIINQLFNNINLLIQVKILLNNRFTQDMIADSLAISKGRTYYLLKDANKLRLNELEKLVKELAQLDLNITLGLEEESIGLELLLLGKRNEFKL